MTELTQIKKVKNKLHPSLVDILTQMAGEDCVKVAEELYNIDDEEITDEELAKICNIKLNIVRKMLYVLYENKLCDFKKERDPKSGWFTYFWHHSFDNLNLFLKTKQESVLKKLLYKIEFEQQNQFYKCTNHNLYKNNENLQQKECIFKTTFNKAMDLNFKCPNCGGELTYYDNLSVNNLLKEKITILKQNIRNLS